MSLAALRRLKMIIDATVQILHDDRQSIHDGGEHVACQTRSAIGIIHPEVRRTDQNTLKYDAQDQKSPGRLNRRRMAVEQTKPKGSSGATRRPR